MYILVRAAWFHRGRVVPRQAWGAYEHTAPVEHLDLEGELRRWSGVRTAGEVGFGTLP